MPPEGQAPQQNFGELAKQTVNNISAMQNIMSNAGAPPEVVQAVEQAQQMLVGALQSLTQGAQQQQAPSQGVVDPNQGAAGARPM